MDKKKTACPGRSRGEDGLLFVASPDDEFGGQQIQCEIGINRNFT